MGVLRVKTEDGYAIVGGGGDGGAATAQPTSIDLSQYESNGRIVETFADGTTKTTTVEFDGNGKPVKITDSAGNTTNLNW